MAGFDANMKDLERLQCQRSYTVTRQDDWFKPGHRRTHEPKHVRVQNRAR